MLDEGEVRETFLPRVPWWVLQPTERIRNWSGYQQENRLPQLSLQSIL